MSDWLANIISFSKEERNVCDTFILKRHLYFSGRIRVIQERVVLPARQVTSDGKLYLNNVDDEHIRFTATLLSS